MEDNKKSNSKYYLLLVLIALQFGTIAYLLYAGTKDKKEIVELNKVVSNKTEEVVVKITALDSLTTEFERIKVGREQCGMSNEALNQQIEELKQFKAKSFMMGAVNAKEKRKFEEIITQMKKELVQKEPEIDQLKVSNHNLEEKLNAVNAEKSKLADSLQTVEVAKKDLESKLVFASVLKAENFSVSSKKKQLTLDFALSDNKVAKLGEKDFYLALSPIDGKVYSDVNNNGGVLTTADGASRDYTYKQTASFTNTLQKLSFVIPKVFKYKRGEYMAQIYSDGYVIGEFNFMVK